MKRAKIIVLVLVLFMIIAIPLNALAASSGWSQDGTGQWSFYQSGWAKGWKYIGRQWYLFDSSGYMLTGWRKVGGKWYYLKDSGAMATGWLKSGNKWYYMDINGVMQTDCRVDGKYYVGVDGAWNQSYDNKNIVVAEPNEPTNSSPTVVFIPVETP